MWVVGTYNKIDVLTLILPPCYFASLYSLMMTSSSPIICPSSPIIPSSPHRPPSHPIIPPSSPIIPSPPPSIPRCLPIIPPSSSFMPPSDFTIESTHLKKKRKKNHVIFKL
uniref:Uncharacterized protein n=1 Tax=Cacopsylla melanoneura TaxID=428564 RepID=A0A8D8RC76_9HEMI